MIMNEDKMMYAGYWIRRFLVEYLVSVRNLSANTRKSYRDTFRLMLPHIARMAGTGVDLLLVSDITPEHIKSFLEEVEKKRKCSVATRNQRLAAIYALAKYIGLNNPEHVEWCRLVHSVPVKKSVRTLITYLEKDEMEALLAAPNRRSEQGRRDYALMLFLYNTGVRADEAASLTVQNLFIPEGKKKGISIVTIKGKGGKIRRCPLWEKTADEIKSLITGRMAFENVFLNRLEQPITRFGIYDMITRYAHAIEDKTPSIKRKRVSPHTIRHTTATHLLQAGVDINTIRAWLGHVSINTTNIYAEVNMKMKADALNCCEIKGGKETQGRWKDDKKLMDFLDNL
jgi:site-specific recombinase XerD